MRTHDPRRGTGSLPDAAVVAQASGQTLVTRQLGTTTATTATPFWLTPSADDDAYDIGTSEPPGSDAVVVSNPSGALVAGGTMGETAASHVDEGEDEGEDEDAGPEASFLSNKVHPRSTGGKGASKSTGGRDAGRAPMPGSALAERHSPVRAHSGVGNDSDMLSDSSADTHHRRFASKDAAGLTREERLALASVWQVRAWVVRLQPFRQELRV